MKASALRVPVGRDIIEGAGADAPGRPHERRGALVWPGLLRRLDRAGASYRT